MKYSIIIVLLLSLFLPSTVTATSHLELEIINIKPAATSSKEGNPAIPATNRIFRAYPGIEYNIRAAVIGGVYPYTYSLSNAPSGMTINSRTGEISWPNPQSNSGTITLTVSDSESTTVTSSWAINVTESGFHFVDSSYAGTSTGSITAPYKSILEMLENVTTTTDVIYFKGGAYQLAPFGASNDGGEYAEIATAVDRQPTNIGSSPFTWLGIPNDTVSIKGHGSIIAGNVYFDNLNFSGFITGHGMRVSSVQHYKTVRRCTFEDISIPYPTNNLNYGFIFVRDNGVGFYFTVQDNEFRNFPGMAAVGSFYASTKVLLENNWIHSNGDEGGGFTVGLGLKYDFNYGTVRGNRVEMYDQAAIGEGNSMLSRTDTVEIAFNFFKRIGPQAQVLIFNVSGYNDSGTTKNLKFHRNTVVGDIEFAFLDGSNYGIIGGYIFSNNVIINPNQTKGGHYSTYDYFSYDWNNVNITTNPWQAITDTGNLKNTSEATVLTSDGLLQPAYTEDYIGVVGWQFADGSTPMEGVLSFFTPQNKAAKIRAANQPATISAGKLPARVR